MGAGDLGGGVCQVSSSYFKGIVCDTDKNDSSNCVVY